MHTLSHPCIEPPTFHAFALTAGYGGRSAPLVVVPSSPAAMC